jgi:hypothetical protein
MQRNVGFCTWKLAIPGFNLWVQGVTGSKCIMSDYAEKFQFKLPKQPKYFNIYKYKLSLRVYTAAIFICSAYSAI